MSAYTYNRTCQCPRCRAHGLMGAAILITLGVLLLLNEIRTFYFNESFPVLLIVIGVFIYLRNSASTEGHVDIPAFGIAPAAPQVPPAPPVPPQPSQDPEVHS